MQQGELGVMTYRGVFVDGYFLSQVQRGNKEAICQFAKIAEEHVRAMADQCKLEADDITPILLGVLNAVAAGASPDEAFRWRTAGRDVKNERLLEWALCQHIDALRADGMSRFDAIKVVGEAATMDGDKGGKLSKLYDKYKGGKLPDDLFPVTSTELGKLKQIIEGEKEK